MVRHPVRIPALRNQPHVEQQALYLVVAARNPDVYVAGLPRKRLRIQPGIGPPLQHHASETALREHLRIAGSHLVHTAVHAANSLDREREAHVQRTRRARLRRQPGQRIEGDPLDSLHLRHLKQRQPFTLREGIRETLREPQPHAHKVTEHDIQRIFHIFVILKENAFPSPRPKPGLEPAPDLFRGHPEGASPI